MPDKALINGRVYTLRDRNEVFEAIGIRDGKVFSLGSNDFVLNSLSKPDVYDLKGRSVYPGFFESHMHLIEASRTLIEVNLKSVESKEEFEEILFSFARKAAISPWVLGSGWKDNSCFETLNPTKKELDSVISERPMCLVKHDGHSLILNSKAIDELNLNSYKNIIPENLSPRDYRGEFTGLFYEDWVFKILSMIMDKMPEEYFATALERANYELLSNGVTSINDIMTRFPKMVGLYRNFKNDGKLNVRLICGPLGGSPEEEGMHNIKGDESIGIGPVKYFMDGSFGSKSALMIEAYEDEPSNFGSSMMDDDKLYSVFEDSLKNNRQIAIHAIGDLAVKRVLDNYEKAFEKYKNIDVRNRIEHIQIVRDEDIERFKKLNLIASFQPVFNLESTLTINRVGLRRIKDTYRYKSFIDRGVTVIFNSDWPFGLGYLKKKNGGRFRGFEPLLGIHCSVNELNLNKEEKVSVMEALECYTKNPAYANHIEEKLGTLSKGKNADLVVLSSDLTEVNKAEIKDVNVDMTMIDGEVVYTREQTTF